MDVVFGADRCVDFRIDAASGLDTEDPRLALGSALDSYFTFNPLPDGRNPVKPLALVGHSYGGLVATEFARRHPARVQGLVLVNGFSEFLLETPKEQERFAQRLKWLRWFGMRPLAWWLGRGLRWPGRIVTQIRRCRRQPQPVGQFTA